MKAAKVYLLKYRLLKNQAIVRWMTIVETGAAYLSVEAQSHCIECSTWQTMALIFRSIVL